jgi:RNA polymerase sigma-70 factor (ECF subfamily)
MSDARALPDADVLLEHAAFLTALARSLVHDEQEAEDVVQETMVAALDKPPRHGNLRGWLAAVTRNLSLTALTRKRRRVARERGVSPRDEEPSVEEALERLELQRRVVEAVLALEEPYRSVILHRFFYDRSLADIAQLMGTPTGTARTRMRRGLEQLRHRLDSAHDGDRRAWAVPLLACYGLRPRPLPSGASVSTPAAVKVAGLIALVAIGTWIAIPRGEAERVVATVEAAPPDELRNQEPEPEPAPEPEPETAPGPGTEPDPIAPAIAKPLRFKVKVPAKRSGFVLVPAGKLHPGTTIENITERASDPKRRAALIYEEWGKLDPLDIPAFYIGRYEVSNAQWKAYLDRRFRVSHETRRDETLRDIAREYVRFRGEGVEREWRAIYAMNWVAIHTALVDAGKWPGGWRPEAPGRELGSLALPGGIDLELYRHRIPHPWYGWCSLAYTRVGREYFDIRKRPDLAFRPPQAAMFGGAKFRAKDFAAYPVRDVSPNEQLAFAEWAGCHLASEYEWERAVRGDRPCSAVHPFNGAWNHNVDKGVFSWADNPRSWPGPLPVDDKSVEKGDTMFGARHMIGNVYELTRTFFDLHPMVDPAPPALPNLFNYALTAKGGSFGDGWIIQQLSVRTGVIGNAQLELVNQNRVDTLGIRLVRHPRPGEDLLRHSIERLTYRRDRGVWLAGHWRHTFALPRMAGADTTDFDNISKQHIYVRGRAKGIAFAPVWQMGRNGVVGVLRSDYPLRIDESETLDPGEWFVVWHENRLGLTDRRLPLPPPVVFPRVESEQVHLGEGAPPARLGKDASNRLWLEFTVEAAKDAVPPPGTAHTELWALCEVHPNGWPGRRQLPEGIRFQVPLDLVGVR